jgi:hypothetical protein
MAATESDGLNFRHSIIKHDVTMPYSLQFFVFWPCITIFYFSLDVLQPSAWIATILGQLTVARLGRKYPEIYGARRFFRGNPGGNHKDYCLLGCDAVCYGTFYHIAEKRPWFIFMADQSSAAFASTIHIILIKTSESLPHSQHISLVHCSICSHLHPKSYFTFRFFI